MNIHSDFAEFLRLLNDAGVDYVVVGGYAVSFYGYVRATKDLDLFFRNSAENIDRIGEALRRFGLPVEPGQTKGFSAPGCILRMGVPPVRIEMINTISGLTFAEAWRGRVRGKYGDVPVFFLSLKHLLVNKRAAGRPKDLADVDELGGNRPAEGKPRAARRPRRTCKTRRPGV